MKKTILTSAIILWVVSAAQAFCGFYVAKAGADLFNQKSEVIIVRDGQRSVVTMSSDFQGDVKDFAMVIPVPHVLLPEDIRIVERSLFSKLDNYSSPRLAEYYDENPCSPPVYYEVMEDASMPTSILRMANRSVDKEEDLGVTIEAKYSVEEYEILILSAKESNGLKIWLNSNGYAIPEKAEEVLDPYIKSGLKFFVVKVDLQKYNPQNHDGYLRPIQMSMHTDKFMLPIRLGMANADLEQDMIVYAFTKTGRVESTNYRTEKVPTNNEIPTFVKDKFGRFYRDLFANTFQKSGGDAVFLEYAWNVSPNWGGMKCDPCVGTPPYAKEFAEAGIFWLNEPGAQVFFTRLHVRYSRKNFPQDLFFQITPNREHFQARYVIRNPATGDLQCEEGYKYLKELRKRRSKELLEMAALTKWDAVKHTLYIYSGQSKVEPEIKQSNQGSILPLTSERPKWLLYLSSFMLLIYLINAIRKRFNLSNI